MVPTRSRSTCIYRPAPGFSLIELMVVVLLIVLGAGIISLSVNDNRGKEMREIAKRFAAFAEYAAQEAALSGEPLGLKWVSPEEAGTRTWRYRWYRYRDGKWNVAGEPLTETSLPTYVEVVLEIDGQGVIKREDTTAITDKNIEGVPEAFKPDTVFFTSGEATPFKLALIGTDLLEDDQHIEVDLVGRIRWEEAQNAK